MWEWCCWMLLATVILAASWRSHTRYRLSVISLRRLSRMSACEAETRDYLKDYLDGKQYADLRARIVRREDVPEGSLIVKSLVWTYQKVNPVLVVLPLDASVDKGKLARHLGVNGPKHVRMATQEQVLSTTGQVVGNVSPIGHKQPVRTIVDAGLVAQYGINVGTIQTGDPDPNDVICYGGGGSDGMELMISLRELIAESSAEIVDVSASPADKATASPLPEAESDPDLEADTGVREELQLPAPHHPTLELTALTSGQPAPAPAVVLGTAVELGKRLRELALRRDSSEPLQQFLLSLTECGQLSTVLNQGTPESGKTALHLAAWKGHIECVNLLLRYGADINQYSIGPGNYGKTALFYAITQCRDDVVVLLLAHGAQVKIVNNKGQTPRSLGVSHLAEDTVALIEAAEEAQRDTAWLNFYASNYSDRNTCFGDLDPRFHELGQKLRGETQQETAGADGGGGCTVEAAAHQLPRSLNATTFAFRRSHYQRYSRADHTLDDMVVTLLRGTVGTEAPTRSDSDSSREEGATLTTVALVTRPDGSLCLDGVVGRVSQVEVISPAQCIVTLLPVQKWAAPSTLAPEATPARWVVQAQATQDTFNGDGDVDEGTAADAQIVVTAANDAISGTLQADRIVLRVGGEDSDLSEGVARSVVAELRVGQTVYTSGRLLGSNLDVDTSSGGSDDVLADALVVQVERIAMIGTFVETAAPEANGKKQVPREGADAEGAALPTEAELPVSFVHLSDIAASFELREGVTDVPVLVVDSFASLQFLEDDVQAMLREIENDRDGTTSTALYRHPVGRLPHVVGMDCEWRPGEIFVRRKDTALTATAPDIEDTTAQDTEDTVALSQLDAVDLTEQQETAEERWEENGDVVMGDADVVLDEADGAEVQAAAVPPQDYPVAVLQLATRRGAYLVDMQTLTAGLDVALANEGGPHGGLLSRLNTCLEGLFRHPLILKLGFKAAPDFEKLACSYPALSCFRRINGVLDTCTLAQHAIPLLIKSKHLPVSVVYGRPLKQLGLSRLCSVVLGGRCLDKAQQCSGWHLRPLTPEQMHYAALDAATLLPILDYFTAHDFPTDAALSAEHVLQHKSYRPVIFNLKFNLYAPAANGKGGVGSGWKHLMGVRVQQQQWTLNQAEPKPPAPPPEDPVQGTLEGDGEGSTRTERNKGIKGKLADRYTVSPAVNAFMQSQSAPAPWSKFLGHHVAQQKEACAAFIQALLTSSHLSATLLAEESNAEIDSTAVPSTALPPPPRSSTSSTTVVQGKRQGNLTVVGNVLAIFANCTDGQFGLSAKDAEARFLDSGRCVVWSVDASQLVRENSARASKIRSFLLDGLLQEGTEDSQTGCEARVFPSEPTIVLFARQNAAPYVFCGRCRVVALVGALGSASTGAGAKSGAVKVTLELVDYDALVGDEELTSYRQMIAAHK